MSYQEKTIEQGREFFKELLPLLDAQKIQLQTAAQNNHNYVGKNINAIFGSNALANIEVLKIAKETNALIPQTETLEGILNARPEAEHNQEELDQLFAASVQSQELSQK